MLSLVCLALVAVPAVAAHADAGWVHLASRRGMELERRPVAGSELSEVRVTTHTDLSVAAVASATWADRFDGKLTKKIRLHWEIVSQTPFERVQYVQVRVPVVSNRDYTLRLRRSYDDHGVFHLDTEAIPERPPQHGFVRIPHARGVWTITPTSDGGCDVVYVAWAEPGGMVPAFVIRNAQLDSALDLVQEVLDWARTH